MQAYDQTGRPGIKHALMRRGGFLLVLAVFLGSIASSCASDLPRRVLILSGYNYTLPAVTQVMDGIKNRLSEPGRRELAVDAEFLDLVRVAEPEHELRTATFVREKYERKPPDVVIAVGSVALQFIMKYRSILAPHIPIVFAGVSPQAYSALNQPSNTTGVLFRLDLDRTLELAEQLQPRTRRLFLITGSSPGEDQRWQETARRTIEQRPGKFETTYLFGLPYETLVAEVSRVPSDAIVVLMSFLIDGAGKTFTGAKVASEIARVSQAPVYATYDSYIGKGVVGGYVEPFVSHGSAAADMALAVLSGKDPAMLPPRVNPTQGFRVDVRAMERWALKERDLPAGTVVLFKEPTLWQQHSLLITAAVLVVALQSLFLTGLLFQRRRRRQAEDSLRESEERMTFAAAAVNVGLWQYDRDTDELWATEHCRAIFGLDRDVPLDREMFLGAVHPDDRRVAASALRGMSKEQSAVTVRIARPDGQERWVRIRARAHQALQGVSEQLNGVFVDITDQKVAETEVELQRKEVTHLMRVSVLGELSGAIAHEVNQPLTAILSNAQAALYLLAQESPDLAEVRDALQDIVHEDNRAGEVVRRLRGLLKKGEAKFEMVDVNEMVQLTTGLLNSELISRRATIETDLAHDLPAIAGDPIQLQQVLLNLIMNAMDAMALTPMPERRVMISTRINKTQRIEVRVKDAGPGFKPVKGNKLFEPFYTTKEHGLGLGLTICSTIVQAHGGEISLSNDRAGGAIASFWLPARETLMAAQ